MTTTLNVRPGLSAPLVNSIPSTWDPQWFRRWITDFLNPQQITAGAAAVIDAGNIHYDISPAESAAGVTPTNYSISSHAQIGGCLLERYGGGIGESATLNSAAFVQASLVAGQCDCPILLTANSGVWSFNSPWILTGTSQNSGGPPTGALGARVQGYLGRPEVNFSGISNTTDVIQLGGITMPQVAIQDLSINFQGTGRDAIVNSGSSFALYENLFLENCARDTDVCSVSGTAFVQNRTVRNVYVYNTGRHARRYQLAGSGGAFVNEELTENFNISGVSALTAGGAAVYMTSSASGAGSKFANHKYSKISWDNGYQSSYLPSGQIPAVSPFVIDSGALQNNVIEGAGGWENTGAVSPGAGYAILITGGATVSGFVMRAGLVTNSYWGSNGIPPAVTQGLAEETSFNRETRMPMTVLGNNTSGTSVLPDYSAIRTGAATTPGPLFGQDACGSLINSTSNTGITWLQWNGNVIFFTSANPNSGASATWTQIGSITATGGFRPGAGFSAIYSGTGAPSSGLGANGDYYFRQDTPGTSSQRIYIKASGSWTALTV